MAAPSDYRSDPDRALERLLAGNARFAADRARNDGRDAVRRAELAAGQGPFAVVLGCSDSRVPPEVIFDQGLGDLFVVRVAGNTAVHPPVVGSVEYAVENLGCSLVLVLGHESCGAVTAALAAVTDGAAPAGPVGEALSPVAAVAARVAEAERGHSKDELLASSIRANIVTAIADVKAGSEAIARRADDGDIRIVGAEYRLASGEVAVL